MLRFDRPEVFLGLGLLALTGLVTWGTVTIPASSYSQVGPAVVPWVATIALAALSVLVLWQGLTGGWDCGEEAEGPIEWPSLLVLLAGLLANVLLIEYIGFILSSTLLFFATAKAFGSREWPRDLAVGFILAFVAYAGFDGVLGYKIGAGGLDDRVSTVIEQAWNWVRPR